MHGFFMLDTVRCCVVYSEHNLCWSLLQFSAQSVMDAAKDVAGRVVSAAQSVATAVSYLPQGLRDGASKAVQQATSLLETVRKVRKRHTYQAGLVS